MFPQTAVFTEILFQIYSSDNKCMMIFDTLHYQFKILFILVKIHIYNKDPDSCYKSGYYWNLDGPSRIRCGINFTVGTSTSVIQN